MKLRLPLFLLSFILSIPAAMPAAADVIGAGVFYDVGKLSFSSDPAAAAKLQDVPAGSDTYYCWAAAASNATQYWQDFYYGRHDPNKDVPDGIVDGGGYGQPKGTAYTQVYQKTLELSKRDTNGSPGEFYDWWFAGKTPQYNVLDDKPAYYGNIFEKKEVAKTLSAEYGTALDLKDFTDFVVETFKTPGQSVSLSILGTANHAISCWGYELDPETNMVSALLLSDSDDKRFSVFRVNVEVRDCYADMSLYLEEGTYEVDGQQISLVTDELAGYYGHDWTWVTEACAIQTPEGINPDEGAPQMKDTLSAGEPVIENTTLAASTTIKGDGVVIGDGESTIVVTTKAPEVSLTMDGTIEGGGKSPQTGMKINDGGTVSLQDFTVENYGKGGVETTGRLYLHNGDVKIADNKTSGAGGGINNTSYVEIQDADTVSFTGNSAEGKGGAINNVNPAGKPTIDTLSYLVKGEAPPFIGLEDEHPTYTTVSLRGNGEVVFSGNSATEGGNDIYNGEFAVVNIADNGNVTFKGAGGEDKKVAIQNDGYLFLSAKEGHSIDFAGSTLESKGATAIGMDANGWTTDAKGEVAFYDNPNKTGGRLSLSSRHGLGEMIAYEDEFFGPMATREYTIPALLKNVSVNADVIMGLGATPGESSVTDTLIRTNNPLAISKLTMNTTDSIVSTSLGDVALDTVVFDLRQAQRTESGAVDLTSMLTGNYTFENVEFLMGDLTEDELKNLTFDISSAYHDAKKTLGIVLRSSKEATQSVDLNINNVTFAFERVPEPTTGTLSLLALAALAARRRRKG